MNRLILIAVVGILGSFVLCWIRRTAVLRDWEAPAFRSAVRGNTHAPADGYLAAMNARTRQGPLGGKRAAHSAHERLAKAVKYSGGR